MKYIITESKAKDIILKYLDVNIEPDYSWGPELHDFYREDVERHGNYDFVINDRLAYSYWDGDGIHKHLEIMPWVYEQLDGLFGGLWEDLFINWFEKNSGLKVDNFVRYE
jgi:hypothetical protein